MILYIDSYRHTVYYLKINHKANTPKKETRPNILTEEYAGTLSGLPIMTMYITLQNNFLNLG